MHAREPGRPGLWTERWQLKGGAQFPQRQVALIPGGRKEHTGAEKHADWQEARRWGDLALLKVRDSRCQVWGWNVHLKTLHRSGRARLTQPLNSGKDCTLPPQPPPPLGSRPSLPDAASGGLTGHQASPSTEHQAPVWLGLAWTLQHHLPSHFAEGGKEKPSELSNYMNEKATLSGILANKLNKSRKDVLKEKASRRK